MPSWASRTSAGGEQVGAFVRFVEGKRQSAAQLESYVREHLARYKTPRIWVEVKDFPMTPSGKIQKFRLVEDYVGGHESPKRL